MEVIEHSWMLGFYLVLLFKFHLLVIHLVEEESMHLHDCLDQCLLGVVLVHEPAPFEGKLKMGLTFPYGLWLEWIFSVLLPNEMFQFLKLIFVEYP